MQVTKLLGREILYRKLNFGLSLLAVVVATTLFVAGPTVIGGYQRQTQVELDRRQDEARKLLRDMGFNLMIVHRDTDMADLWAEDFAKKTMPQDYVDRLAKARELTLVTHLVATLQERVKWNGRTVLLVGYLPESTQLHRSKKAPMGYNVEPGTAILGYELRAGREAGQTIEVLGKSLTIARILDEKGSKEDITIAVSLSDAQAMLDKPAQVNQILALGCQCAGDRLEQIRAQLGTALPGTKITEFKSIAVARAEERKQVAAARTTQMGRMENLAAVTTPAVVLGCSVWVGLLALSNVRERRTEIGLWRALGIGSGRVATLFLGKAMILGLAGGVVGLALGAWGAQLVGVRLDVPSEFLHPAPRILVATVFGAPLLCALASWLPTLTAVMQDPAVVLSQE